MYLKLSYLYYAYYFTDKSKFEAEAEFSAAISYSSLLSVIFFNLYSYFINIFNIIIF